MKKSIIKTLSYFDLFDHPLTFLEIDRLRLQSGPETGEVWESLEELKQEGKISEINGFYFLTGRQAVVAERLKRYPEYFQRVEEAVRVVKVLRFVPYVRGVALTGSVAGMYPTVVSDIDFLIIVQPGRIWLARLMVTLAVQLLGKRRYGHKVAKRICLNHYVVEKSRLDRQINLYTAVEYATMLCLLNPSVVDDFLQQQTWLEEYLYLPSQESNRCVWQMPDSRLWRPFWEKTLDWAGGGWLERRAQRLQEARIRVDETVFVSPTELSFHPNSKALWVEKKLEGMVDKSAVTD